MTSSKMMHPNFEKPPDDDDNSFDPQKEIKLLQKNVEKLEKDVKSKNGINLVILSLVIVVAISLFVFASVIIPQSQSNNLGQTNNGSAELRGSYLVQNLKGDKINTWISWKIVPTDVFHIHVIQSDQVTESRLKIIHDVIFSEEKLEIANEELHKSSQGITTYYKGWAGALKVANLSGTTFSVPISFHTQITELGEGNVIIKLTDLENPDGYAGYTKSLADENNHQILKSEITIYDVDSLSDENFEAVVRHELGHAFGLAHSSDPDDLMYDVILTTHPYISECDVGAIEGLYNGSEKSEVICQV